MISKLVRLSSLTIALSSFSQLSFASAMPVTPIASPSKRHVLKTPPTDAKSRLSSTLVHMDRASKILFASPQKSQLGLEQLALLATSLQININTSDSRLKKLNCNNGAFTLELDGFSFENGRWELTEDKSGSGIPDLIKNHKIAHAEQFIAEEYLNHKFKNLKKLKILLAKLDELFPTEEKILKKISFTLNPAGKNSGSSYDTSEKETRILVRILFSLFDLDTKKFGKTEMPLRYVLRTEAALGDIDLDLIKNWEIKNKSYFKGKRKIKVSDVMSDIFSDKIQLSVRTGRSLGNKMVSARDGEKLDLFQKIATEIQNDYPDATSNIDMIQILSISI